MSIEEFRRLQRGFNRLQSLNVFGLQKRTKISYVSAILALQVVLTIACGKLSVNSEKALMICSFDLVVLKSLLEVPSDFRIPSIRNPKVAVDDMVSLQTMYLGLVTPFIRCSSSVGAFESIWHIFSYMSCQEDQKIRFK